MLNEELVVVRERCNAAEERYSTGKKYLAVLGAAITQKKVNYQEEVQKEFWPKHGK